MHLSEIIELQIAPPPTPLQDFSYHWKQLMNFYASHQTNCKISIESTGIPHHVDRLLEILLNEEKKDDNPGPCLEYLLQHKLLDWLATLASVETPPGMRLICLSFLRRFLARSKFPLLHQASVYGPVQKLITLCSGNIPSPIENEEIQFLLTICFLVCRYPQVTSIINDPNIDRIGSGTLKNDDSERFDKDKHSVTYVPSRKQSSNNLLFEPLNTQAVTLLNPNLLASDHQRRKSFSVGSKKSIKKGEKSLRRKSTSASIDLPENSVKFSSPQCEKPISHESLPLETILDGQDYDSCDKESRESCDDIDVKDLEDNKIDIDSRENEENNADEFKSAQSLESPIKEGSSSLLLDALISYLNSADNTVRIRACEGIMVLGSLEESSFARIISQSNLPKVVTNRLETLFNAIPAHVDPTEIDIDVTWGLDSPLWTNEKMFPGCRQVASYFMWLDYCDQLIKEAHPDLAHVLAKSIRKSFFDNVVTPALSDHHVVLITSIITQTIKRITSFVFNTEISYWLVGEERNPMIAEMCSFSILERLVENCYTDSDDLTLETLKFFEEILDKRNEHILHCMVLLYLNSRGYYDNTAADSTIASWSDEEDEREREKKGSLDFSIEPGHSRTLAPSNIHRIINCFLSLTPKQLQTDPGEDNYERYMADWEKQYERAKIDCALFAWPLEAITVDDSGSYDSRPEADHCSSRFYPGPFLSMLLDKVSNIPNQKYEVNLQLTVVISRLALFPHPYLHEFLLNPLLPLTAGTTSLFGCLQKTIKMLASEVTKMPKYKEFLKKTRQNLLEDHNQGLLNDNMVYESVVITEEFCKELAAIAYVKYQHSM